MLFDGVFYIDYIAMTNTFIIRLKRTHYCMSTTSSLEHCGELIKKHIKKYKTPEALYGALSDTYDGGKLPQSMLVTVLDRYKGGDWKQYEDFVEECVAVAEKEMSEESTMTMKRLTKARMLSKKKKPVLLRVKEEDHKKEGNGSGDVKVIKGRIRRVNKNYGITL